MVSLYTVQAETLWAMLLVVVNDLIESGRIGTERGV